MNCSQHAGGCMRMPERMPMSGSCGSMPMVSGPGPIPTMVSPAQYSPESMWNTGGMCGNHEHFPVGMGYVPMQNWENPYPMEHGFRRGTIFPSLDYPFTGGRCR